ncbi:hypothetical protein [Desulfuromonas sp. TF]|uniref:hypothetical protein n=1 Tax=Desulfuromonas sp. TF TaxID=1232410 RepID=UPI000486C6BD|nr:hypothetical protein [Desulfuromonas sp. TF]
MVWSDPNRPRLSSVLNSERAVQVNIAIMRAFVQMRELASSNREFGEQVRRAGARVGKHDEAIHTLFDAIRKMMRPEEKGKKSIGFKVEEDGAAYV